MDIRVRFVETDVYGLVHHSNFFIWFETGRIEYLRELGLTLEVFLNENIRLVLKNCSCETLSGVQNDEIVSLKTRLVEVTPVKIVFEYEISNKSTGKVAVTGRSTNVFVDSDGKVKRLDSDTLKRFE